MRRNKNKKMLAFYELLSFVSIRNLKVIYVVNRLKWGL